MYRVTDYHKDNKKKTGKQRRIPNLVTVLTMVTVQSLCLSSQAYANLPIDKDGDAVFAKLTKVGDKELAASRGGFVTSSGLRIDFGFNQKTLVDGNVVDEKSISSGLRNQINEQVRREVQDTVKQIKQELVGGQHVLHDGLQEDYGLEPDLKISDLTKDNHVRRIVVDGSSADVDLDSLDYSKHSLKELNLPKLLGSGGIYKHTPDNTDHEKGKNSKNANINIDHGGDDSFLKTLIQVGDNNVFFNNNADALDAMEGLVTVIQNSADNKTIQNLNILDLNVSDFGKYKDSQVGVAVNQQLLLNLH